MADVPLPTLPQAGSTDWIGWAAGIHDRATTLPATYAPRVVQLGGIAAANAAPVATKYSSNPIFTGAQSQLVFTGANASGIYYWQVVKAKGKIATPIDNYYAFFSTDHSANAGGIGLATAPTPLGPWTWRQQVFVDSTAGNQTEVASIEYDDVNSRWIMFYKNSTVGTSEQSVFVVLAATSTDLVTWTRYGVVLKQPDYFSYPGDTGVGYFHPFRFGGLWGGWYLNGSGNYPHWGLAWSYDGLAWQMDPKPIGYHMHLADSTGANGFQFTLIGTVPFLWNGQTWGVVNRQNFVSGSAPQNNRLYVCRLAPNMRQLVGAPKLLIDPLAAGAQAWESGNIRAWRTFIDDNGSAYLYYQCGTNIGVAVLS